MAISCQHGPLLGPACFESKAAALSVFCGYAHPLTQLYVKKNAQKERGASAAPLLVFVLDLT